MGNNKYTDEFRRETADYVISTGRPITEVAKELGPNGKTADDWVPRRKRSRASRRAQRPRCASCVRSRGAYVSPRWRTGSWKRPRPLSPKGKGCRQVPPDDGGKGRIPG